MFLIFSFSCSTSKSRIECVDVDSWEECCEAVMIFRYKQIRLTNRIIHEKQWGIIHNIQRKKDSVKKSRLYIVHVCSNFSMIDTLISELDKSCLCSHARISINKVRCPPPPSLITSFFCHQMFSTEPRDDTLKKFCLLVET